MITTLNIREMTYLQKVERKPAEGEEEDDDNHHFDHLSKKSESGVNINPVTLSFIRILLRAGKKKWQWF